MGTEGYAPRSRVLRHTKRRIKARRLVKYRTERGNCRIRSEVYLVPPAIPKHAVFAGAIGTTHEISRTDTRLLRRPIHRRP